MSRYKIKFLSAQKTRERAFGEVLEAKLLNKKTQLPVLGGLFCPRVFGPLEDYRCACPTRGDEKEKKVHRKDEVCPKCGVKFELKGVTRRHRSGYVHFNVPIINPLAIDLLSEILGLSLKDFLGVVTRELWLSWEPTDEGTVIIDDVPHTITCNETWGAKHNLPSSPKGLYELVWMINLEATQALHQKKSESAEGKEAKTWKKTARFLASCLDEGLRLSDLFITDMAIMPPDLRPAYMQGNTEVVNPKSLLYTIMMKRASRLRFMHDVNWKAHPALFKPYVIQEESRTLQDKMAELLIKGSMTAKKVPVKSFMQDLSGKPGHLRNKMLGKRVDFSGRTVITPGPHLSIDEVGIPRKIAYELFRPWILRSLLIEYGFSSRKAKLMIKKKDPFLREVLAKVVEDKVVILNRQPSLHRMSMFCFHIQLHDGKSVFLHPMVCAPFNADFDGDQMAIHVPVQDAVREETMRLMFPSENLLSPADGSPIIAPSHEMIIGAYDMTSIKEGKPYVCLTREKAVEAYGCDRIRLNDLVEIRTPARFGGGIHRTCVGRILLENVFGLPIDEPLTKKNLKTLISNAYDHLGKEKLPNALDSLKVLAYKHVTSLGFSLGINDFVIPSTREERMNEARDFANDLAAQCDRKEITDDERKERKIRKWMETIETLQNDFIREAGPQNPLVIMLKTGARVSMTQVSQLVVAKGMQAKSGGGIIEDPIENCTRTKLTTFEFFVSCYGARKSMADKKMATPLSGYLARRLVNAARDLYISEYDCGYFSEGLELKRCDATGRTSTSGEYFSEPSVSKEYVSVRSPIFCRAHDGVCATCYGLDFSKRKPVELGTPVGVIAAQSLTEPCTQLTMRTFHTSGAAELKDSPLVIYSTQKGEVYLEPISDDLLNVYVDKDKYIIHKKLARLLVKDEQMVEAGTPLVIYTSKNLANEDIGGKLVLLDSYYEARKLKKRHAAVIAKEAGVVDLQPTEEDTKILILVNGKEQGTVKDVPVFVHKGETVRKGQFLSYGEANLHEYEADLECAGNAFVQRVQYLYEQEGITPATIHMEMIFRSMTEFVDNDEENFGLLRFNEPGVRRLLGVSTIGTLYPSWLKAVGVGHTKEGLIRAVTSCAISRDLPSERIMTGEYPLFQLKEPSNDA